MVLIQRFRWGSAPLWVRVLIAGVVYAVAAEIGNRLSVQNAFSTFWPPAGVSFVLLAISDPREWPALIAGVVVANVASDLAHGRDVLVAAGFATANACEAVLGAALARRAIGSPPRLHGGRDVWLFGLLPVCIAPAVGAAIGATVVTAAFGGWWPMTWATWWTGDALGLLTVGALGLTLAEALEVPRAAADRKTPWWRIAAFVVLLTMTCVAAGIATARLGPIAGWKFVLFLPVGVAAAYSGVFGATTMSFALSITMSWALAAGERTVTLAAGARATEVFVLQGFLAVIAITALSMAVTVAQARRAADAQRAMADKYRVLLETLPIGGTISDASGAILEVSRAAEAILGVSTAQQRERDIGGEQWTILDPDGRPKPQEDWVSVRALREATRVRGQEGVRRPDGTLTWLDVTAAPIPGDGYGVAICYLDVTEQVEIRERLRESEVRLTLAADHLEDLVQERTADLERVNEELREASAAKSRFLANMSHELRTPLNSVIGFAGVLEQGMAGPLNDEQTREIRMIRAAGERLLALVNDLLDLTRIEAGRADLDISAFDVGGLLSELELEFRRAAEAKGLTLRVQGPEAPVTITSDRLRLGQILTNLLSNAVKFTDTGHITLTCAIDGGTVGFRVEDTGMGIPPEELPHITEEFHQVDRPSDGMKPPGTGLGLAISSRLAGMLGGTLAVESAVGAGTVFTLRLPREAARS